MWVLARRPVHFGTFHDIFIIYLLAIFMQASSWFEWEPVIKSQISKVNMAKKKQVYEKSKY